MTTESSLIAPVVNMQGYIIAVSRGFRTCSSSCPKYTVKNSRHMIHCDRV